MIVVMMYRMKSDRTRGTGQGPVYLDTGAKPGHAMLPDMGFYHEAHQCRVFIVR